MRDIVDQANDLAQLELDNLLANRQTFAGESAKDCIGCGEPIPEKRRQLLKGCQLCVDCQSLKELFAKR
ncbi:TraR/DksA family transcriptional regulator [Gilliamella apis]|uniref:TraR/DksA family transcriptional regulator n=1 Tax=Gilliamella apis TaxID=1970738 RepID=UPI000D78B20C|nr:TraR/DksA family transcriptional regulator [Gilliamella apis]PXY93060.1 conjugal transfer protein TraR [Gilliamella apis]WLS95353.1 TraR/DksA family transcriptional regulator [Gilliamella apis]